MKVRAKITKLRRKKKKIDFKKVKTTRKISQLKTKIIRNNESLRDEINIKLTIKKEEVGQNLY